MSETLTCGQAGKHTWCGCVRVGGGGVAVEGLLSQLRWCETDRVASGWFDREISLTWRMTNIS